MKLNFKKIKENLLRLPKKLAENSFLATITLIFLAGAAGGATFYKYSTSLVSEGTEIIVSDIKFKEEAYQRVITHWQERAEHFEAANTKTYPNLFSE